MHLHVSLLHENFHLVLQAEAGLLGHVVELGPHGATHICLAVDEVMVGAAVDTDKRGFGDQAQNGSDRPMRLVSLGPTVLCCGNSTCPPGLSALTWRVPSITMDVGRTDLPDHTRLVVQAL